MDEKKIRTNIFGRVAQLFINQFQLTLLVILLIISLGISGLFSLPKESLPEIVFPTLTIQTIYPGASPEDVEFLVTEKIENKVKDFDDIDSIDSETGFGISVITVSFDEGVDINQKKIEVDNALKELSFSEGVEEPKSLIFTTSEIPLMNVSVAGEYTTDLLTVFGEEIANAIEGVRGVEEVVLSGGVNREIEIVTNELAMMKYGITFNMIREALSGQNFSAPIGELALNGIRYNLRVDERYKTVQEIRDTKITEQVRVDDIAQVIDGIEPVNSFSRTFIRGDNEEALPSVFLTVRRKVGSDVLGTSQEIHELIRDGKGTLFPEDLTVNISNDLAVNVSDDLSKIQESAWSGLIVVVIVLFLFIGFRESVIVSLAIPLSLLGTVGLLNLFGITFNTFAVLGLIVALGLLVDNSIIVMENIDRLKKKGMTVEDAAFYGTNQVGFPIVSATFTTLAAFFPLAILPGILGAFVSTIPITIMITITVSLIVSIAITPSIASKILQVRKSSKYHGWIRGVLPPLIVAVLSFYAFWDQGRSIILAVVMMSFFTSLMILKQRFLGDRNLDEVKWIQNYADFIGWIATKKRRAVIVVIIGFAVLFGSFATFGTGLLKIAFFPNSEPSSLNINIDTVGGMTLEETDRVTRDVEQVLYGLEGVSQFNSTVGGSEIDYAVISVEISKSTNGFELLSNIEEQLRRIPDAVFNITTIAQGPPVGKPIELRVLGDDLRASNAFSNQLVNALEVTAGVYNIESSSNPGVPQLIVDIDKVKSQIYGISPALVTSQLRGELNGVVVSSIRLQQEEIDIVVRKDLQLIDSIEGVDNLFIAIPGKSMVTLSAISDLEVQNGVSKISRKDGERVITVSADLREGFNATEIVSILREQFPEQSLPDGVDLKYSGDIEGIEQNFGNLFQSMILAVFLVFIILTLQFRSLGQPFIILTTIPMALIGVIWGLVITRNEFGFYSFMGLVALAGIAVNDAIVLIDYINYLKREGYSTVDAIKEAGKTRFNPVLATTITTISGVLPLAFKEAYYAQFSFALIFGLLMTTVLTLIYIPTIYSLYSKKVES